MTGTMQSQYRAPAEVWQGIVGELLATGYIVEERANSNQHHRFCEIRGRSPAIRNLWVEITSDSDRPNAPAVLIDMHWLTRTTDADPDWMLRLAAKIEKSLMEAGAQCIFGEVHTDRLVKARLQRAP